MLVTSNVIKDPRVQKEAQIAAENGMSVTVVGRADNSVDQSPLQCRIYDVLLIPIARKDSDNLLQRILERVKFIFRLYRHCIELKPDLIHANDFDTLPSAFYASRKIGSPVVYDSHEIWTENGEIAEYKLLKWAVQQYEKYLVKRIACVISVSNAAADKLMQMHNISRPEVITNCPYSLPQRNAIIKNEGFEVIYHGIFSPDRGYEEFCQAALELPDEITLVLRGYGPSEDGLRQLVDKLQLNTRVRFDKPVAVSELSAAAARSHVGAVLTRPVSINYTYTVSNKVFEYIQAGLPVVLSDIPEHRYLVEKYGVGLTINEVTPTAIAEAIIKLRSDVPLYNNLRQNVLLAAQELCWEKEGLKLIDIYKKAVVI